MSGCSKRTVYESLRGACEGQQAFMKGRQRKEKRHFHLLLLWVFRISGRYESHSLATGNSRNWASEFAVLLPALSH